MKAEDSNPEAQDVAEKNQVWDAGDALRHRASRVITGDLIGNAAAIGAVVAARRIPALARLSEKLDSRFSHRISPCFSATFPNATAARMATNNAIMMGAGLSNPISQYIMLRFDGGAPEAPVVDLAQVGLSRVVSTFTAGAAVTLAEMHAPQALRVGEQAIDFGLNVLRSDRSKTPKLMIDSKTAMSETLVHNFTQSIGGVAGETVFQSAYDRMIGRDIPDADGPAR